MEGVMIALSSLELFPCMPRNSENAFFKARQELIAKIDKEISLGTDSTYKPTTTNQVNNEDVPESKVEIPKRIRR